jgi:hypothetical protein
MPEIAFTDTGSYGPVIGDAEFDFIRHVVGENAGIVLGPHKRQLVQGRLGRRLRELGLQSYQQYCEHLRSSGPEELVGLINALTTNVTAFFRENHHFEALAEYMLPEAMRRNAGSRRIRIWSAGCSTGEEPYCAAMTAADVVPPIGWDCKILATDIDSDVIAFGQHGVYPLDRVASLPTCVLSEGHGHAGWQCDRQGAAARRCDVPRAESAAAVANARSVRRDSLPQRDDLLRPGDARASGASLRRDSGSRRLSVHRSLRVVAQCRYAAARRRQDDLSQDRRRRAW